MVNQKTHNVTNTSSNAVGYKINTQILIMQTNNTFDEKETRKPVPFTIMSHPNTIT